MARSPSTQRTPTAPARAATRAHGAQKTAVATKKKKSTKQRATRDASRDSFDFRDLIYRPALLEVKPQLLPDWKSLHILDQRKEGACTGFGLAAVINYQNARAGSQLRVSPRMLFEMAKRYDEFRGEKYDYSSARGAMKGWHKHGVCSETKWPAFPPKGKNVLTYERQLDALGTVLGAYYRVLNQRSHVHAALLEAGVVYAASDTHDGWDNVPASGVIPYKAGDTEGGGHAFAIVGYTHEGFLIQNSWGEDWGGWVDAGGKRHDGIALWTYPDFDFNVWDVWVARKALPVESISALTGRRYVAGPAGTRVVEQAPPAHEIWNHYVHIDDGQFDPQGDYPSSAQETAAIAARLVAGYDNKPAPKHLLLYAHGGLNSVASAAQRVAKMQPVFDRNGIASLHFIWETGLLAELRDVLLGKQDFAEKRVARESSWWDRFLENVTRPLGAPLWNEMREDAALAFATAGKAGSMTLQALAGAIGGSTNKPKVHLVAHSAGSLLFGRLLAANAPVPIDNLILFAPACTTDFFTSHIQPALAGNGVKQMHHFHLDDQTEQDDNVAGVYRKSLLYLVSNAYEDRRRKEVPLLGMEIYWKAFEPTLPASVRQKIATYTPVRTPQKTAANCHGGFDNDVATMNAVLEIVTGSRPPRENLFTKDDLSGF